MGVKRFELIQIWNREIFFAEEEINENVFIERDIKRLIFIFDSVWNLWLKKKNQQQQQHYAGNWVSINPNLIEIKSPRRLRSVNFYAY